MSSKMKTCLICAFLIGLFLLPVRSSFPGDELLLRSVDKIVIRPDVDLTRANLLYIRLEYVQQSRGQVFWTGGTVKCHCDVYEYHEETGGDEKRGIPIAHVDKTIRADIEQIAVDLPERHLNEGMKGLVECSFDTGTHQLSATETFRMK